MALPIGKITKCLLLIVIFGSGIITIDFLNNKKLSRWRFINFVSL